MVQVIMKPEIFKYATCKEFAEGFALGAEDFPSTNTRVYATKPSSKSISLR